MLRIRESQVASTDSCSNPGEYPPLRVGARYIVPSLHASRKLVSLLDGTENTILNAGLQYGIIWNYGNTP